MLNPEVFAMKTLTKAAVLTVGLVGGFAVTAHAQYYNYYSAPNTYLWSPYNYPGYRTSVVPKIITITPDTAPIAIPPTITT